MTPQQVAVRLDSIGFSCETIENQFESSGINTLKTIYFEEFEIRRKKVSSVGYVVLLHFLDFDWCVPVLKIPRTNHEFTIHGMRMYFVCTSAQTHLKFYYIHCDGMCTAWKSTLCSVNAINSKLKCIDETKLHKYVQTCDTNCSIKW